MIQEDLVHVVCVGVFLIPQCCVMYAFSLSCALVSYCKYL